MQSGIIGPNRIIYTLLATPKLFKSIKNFEFRSAIMPFLLNWAVVMTPKLVIDGVANGQATYAQICEHTARNA